jgi:hypothetical protein
MDPWSPDSLKPSEERRAKSLAELAAEQWITQPRDFEALLGAGADLWDNEADFEAFLAALRESRQSGE